MFVVRRYDLVSIAWMAFLAAVAAMIWVVALPQTIGRGDSAAALEAASPRDDAQAIISRFGFPEVDSASDPASAPAVRVMTYRERGVRVTFVRRASVGAPAAWKLNAFLDLDHDAAVAGDEAIKRLKNTWR